MHLQHKVQRLLQLLLRLQLATNQTICNIQQKQLIGPSFCHHHRSIRHHCPPIMAMRRARLNLRVRVPRVPALAFLPIKGELRNNRDN